jgi:hypothetical protein
MAITRLFRLTVLLAALAAAAGCHGSSSDSSKSQTGAAPAPAAATSAPAPAAAATATAASATAPAAPATPAVATPAAPVKRPSVITNDDADVIAKLAAMMDDLGGAAEKNASDCDKAGDALTAIIAKDRPIIDKAKKIDARLKGNADADAWIKATYAARLQVVVGKLQPLVGKCSSNTKVTGALQSISPAPTTTTTPTTPATTTTTTPATTTTTPAATTPAATTKPATPAPATPPAGSATTTTK